MESFSKRSQENFSHTTEQEHGVEDNIEPIALSYNDLLKLLNNYEQYGVLYHGTAHSAISRKVLPPFETQIISERGRKKNLDRVFFTKDPKSAAIYAGRAANSYGGTPRVLRVIPFGKVEVLNANDGTTVFYSPSAIVLSPTLERMLSDLSSKNNS
jgi:hypothetical protein